MKLAKFWATSQVVPTRQQTHHGMLRSFQSASEVHHSHDAGIMPLHLQHFTTKHVTFHNPPEAVTNSICSNFIHED